MSARVMTDNDGFETDFVAGGSFDYENFGSSSEGSESEDTNSKNNDVVVEDNSGEEISLDEIDAIFEEHPMSWLNQCGEFCRPVNRRVAQLYCDFADQGKDLPMTVVAGPGVLYARKAVALFWLGNILLPCVAYKAMECPEEGQYVQPPMWLLFIAVVPTLLVAVAVESKILSYVLLVYVKVSGKFPWFGGLIEFTNYPFFFWRTITLVLGICGKLQLTSNALFVAKILKVEACPGGDEVEDVWEEVWSQSLFASFRIPTFKFGQTVVFVGALHFLELLNVLCMTVPVGPKEKPDYDHATLNCMSRFWSFCKNWMRKPKDFEVHYDLPTSYSTARTYNFEYATVLDTQQNNGAALMYICSAVRMYPVIFPEFLYDREKMRQHLNQRSPNYKFRYLHHTHHVMTQAIHSFFLVGVIQSVLQLNLQVTLMGLLSSTMNVDHADKLTVASLVFNTVVMLVRLSQAWRTRSLYNEVCAVVNNDTPHDHPFEMDTSLRELWSRITLMYYQFACFVFLYICGTLYALKKIIAFYSCPDHLVNLTGCVELKIGT